MSHGPVTCLTEEGRGDSRKIHVSEIIVKHRPGRVCAVHALLTGRVSGQLRGAPGCPYLFAAIILLGLSRGAFAKLLMVNHARLRRRLWHLLLMVVLLPVSGLAQSAD